LLSDGVNGSGFLGGATVIGTWGTRGSVLLATWAVVVLSTWRSHGVLRAGGHASLEESQDLLDELDGVGSLQEVGINRSGVLSLHVEEVSLVLSVCLHLLADLWKLVVGYEQVLALDELVMEVRAGIGSEIGLLEADEGAGRGLALLNGEDSDALDLTKGTEEALQLSLGEGGGETLNEEVALLLGVLESLLLAENLSLSLRGREGGLNVDLEAIEFLFVKIVDGVLSTFRAVLRLSLAVIADESK
jgi:hypothetical protein